MFVGAAAADERVQHLQRADADKHSRRHHPYHHHHHRRRQPSVLSNYHDWFLNTDADRLMQLLGGRAGFGERSDSWLQVPPSTPLAETETIRSAASSAGPVDWRRLRRQEIPSPTRPVNDDTRATHVDELSTSNYCQSGILRSHITASAATTGLVPAGVDEGQQFPVYQPLVGRIFPATSSDSFLSSSLAYEMLATAALSSLRHAVPFAALLPASSTSYDVISAAAAALLQPQSLAAAAASTTASSSVGQPEVDRVDDGGLVSAGSALDLVVAPASRVEAPAAAGNSRDASAERVKSSPNRGDRDGGQRTAVGGPRPRGCVWRPY